MASPDHPQSSKRSSEQISDPNPGSSSVGTTKRQRVVTPATTPNNDIPSSSHYHVSYAHRSTVTFIRYSSKHDMILTMSQDGVVKFWKRTSVSNPPVVDLPTSSSATKPQPMDATGKCMEFIKSYTAHTAPPQAMVMSLPDGDTAASVGEDNVIKFYDIGGFDVTGMIKVGKDYKCGRCAAFIGEDQTLVAVSSGSVKTKDQKPTSSASSSLRVGDIFIFSSLTLSPIPIRTITHHTVPVTVMSYNYKHQCMISCDSKGVLEYWNGAILNNSSDKIIYGEASSSAITSVVNDYEAIEDVGRNHAETIQQREVNESTFESIGALPTNAINGISFASKLNDTDLCSLLKKKTYAISLTVSPTGNHFAVYGSDRKVRLFDYSTGKILVNYDERMKVYDALVKKHASRPTSNGMDAIDYGKRAATEREMTETSVFTAPVSAVDNLSLVEESGNQSIAMEFDPTGRYILLPTIIGIKVIEWKTNKCKQIIGKGDASTLRLLGGCICLGNARVDRQMLLARGGMENNVQTQDEKEEPISDSLFVTMAYKKRRIYVFSHSDPVTEAEEKGNSEQQEVYFSRDILNEPPDPEELILNSQGQAKEENKLGKEAILRTTMGDIHIKLFPNDTPRTIENFCGHARSGYYDNVIFHRVIKGFMIQTGDPLGDGTGGESIWGGEFEDEFVRDLRHDRPFTVSMANAGPGTNGSQFFISTVPCPWLDNKHTVFGRVTKGMDICSTIEAVKVDEMDKPLEEVSILSVDITA